MLMAKTKELNEAAGDTSKAKANIWRESETLDANEP